MITLYIVLFIMMIQLSNESHSQARTQDDWIIKGIIDRGEGGSFAIYGGIFEVRNAGMSVIDFISPNKIASSCDDDTEECNYYDDFNHIKIFYKLKSGGDGCSFSIVSTGYKWMDAAMTEDLNHIKNLSGKYAVNTIYNKDYRWIKFEHHRERINHYYSWGQSRGRVYRTLKRCSNAVPGLNDEALVILKDLDRI